MVNYPLRKEMQGSHAGLRFESLDVSKIYLVNILLERFFRLPGKSSCSGKFCGVSRALLYLIFQLYNHPQHGDILIVGESQGIRPLMRILSSISRAFRHE